MFRQYHGPLIPKSLGNFLGICCVQHPLVPLILANVINYIIQRHLFFVNIGFYEIYSYLFLVICDLKKFCFAFENDKII